MEVYLVQHGLAVSEERDPQRPLSDEGRMETTRVAAQMAALGRRLVDPPLSQIWHSGKLRAEQTAEIIARTVAPELTPASHGVMSPADDPAAICKELTVAADRPGAILLVGHLPHLARLTGLLLTGDARMSPVRFVHAAVLRLGFRGGSWAVDWYMTPACVP